MTTGVTFCGDPFAIAQIFMLQRVKKMDGERNAAFAVEDSHGIGTRHQAHMA